MNSLVGRCKLVFNYVVNRGKVKKKKSHPSNPLNPPSTSNPPNPLIDVIIVRVINVIIVIRRVLYMWNYRIQYSK